MPRPSKEIPDIPRSVRFPLPLLAQIKAVKAKMPGYSEQEVIRLAVEIGLVALARVRYRVAQLVAEAAFPSGKKPNPGARTASRVSPSPRLPLA